MKKILVIDGEREQRKAIIRFLSKTGDYEFLEADNDKTGIRTFVIHHPDIVIVDLHLSGARGEEMARFIKRDPKTKTKVICLSGDPNLERVVKAAGCDVFLKKPFHLLQLQEEMGKLLKKNYIKTLTRL